MAGWYHCYSRSSGAMYFVQFLYYIHMYVSMSICRHTYILYMVGVWMDNTRIKL